MLRRILCNIAEFVSTPIIKNKVFFFNIILLLVIPTMINAYWINHEQYVTFSKIYKYGVKIQDGASIPYIFFIPYVVAYIISYVDILLRYWKKQNVFIFMVYTILMFFFIINVFCLLNFSTMISPSIVMLMVETNGGEASEFFSTYIFCGDSLLAYMINAIMMAYLCISEKRFNVLVTKKKWIVFYFLMTLYMFNRVIEPVQTFLKLFDCKNLTEAELWYSDYPVNTNMFSNAIYSAFVMDLSRSEMTEAMQSTLANKETVDTDKDVNIVMIIGESYSKHHSSLYGYEHRTNPCLQAQVDSGHLFVFNDVISSYNLTSFVLRNLFSVNSIMDKENWAALPAFPIFFKNAGYNVYFWDNQRTFGKADVSDFSIASYLFNDKVAKASYTKYNDRVFPYDWGLIKDFWNTVHLEGEKNLLIFHLMGQHTKPEMRYPHGREFDVFNSDSIHRTDLDERRRRQVAHYDNSTLYNDWLVDSIMKHYAADNAVVIYFSDHGEEVYDFRDHYGRTQEAVKSPDLLKYQYEIPFMIWCSEKFMEERPDVVENIAAAVDKPFMNDNVCQILFGLVGMQIKYYHPERDLLSPEFKPYSHRDVQGTVNYEKVRWGR